MTRNELVDAMSKAADPLSVAMDGSSFPTMKRAMSAALDVAMDETLKEPSEDEIIHTSRPGVIWAFGKGLDYDRVRDIFANRRAALAHVKTVEERVTVGSTAGHYIVYLDGKEYLSFSNNHFNRATPEIYRLGLIQQLKEQP